MIKQFFRKHLPSHDSVRNHKLIRRFGPWLAHHNLWHLHRRSVAGGVAIGLFCGMIPGPFQMLSAALCAIAFRVNLPVALVTTFYTNPFTIVPLYIVAYELGSFFVPGTRHALADFEFDWGTTPWREFIPAFMHWVGSMGHAFVIGLPLLAIGLAVIGYFAVRAAWRLHAIMEWRRRAKRHANQSD
jgi:uncharacterized protein (DUF2062 family)